MCLSKTRLNTGLDNICNLGKPPARCALHRWLGYETEKDLKYCSSCNVNLCVRCNRIFHTVPGIILMRDTLKKGTKRRINLNDVLRLTDSISLCWSHVLLQYYIIINVKSYLFLLIFWPKSTRQINFFTTVFMRVKPMPHETMRKPHIHSASQRHLIMIVY